LLRSPTRIRPSRSRLAAQVPSNCSVSGAAEPPRLRSGMRATRQAMLAVQTGVALWTVGALAASGGWAAESEAPASTEPSRSRSSMSGRAMVLGSPRAPNHDMAQSAGRRAQKKGPGIQETDPGPQGVADNGLLSHDLPVAVPSALQG